MKNKVKNLDLEELKSLNGGGWLYDLYKVVVAEGEDFAAGFTQGLTRGFF